MIIFKGNDDVAICKVNSAGVGVIEHYYTTGRVTPIYLSEHNRACDSDISV